MTPTRRRPDPTREAIAEERLDAIRQFAAGLAHDLGNALLAASLQSERALERLAPGDPSRAPVERIQRALDRATGLARGLVAVAGRQASQPCSIDLARLAQDAEGELRQILGPDVAFELRLDGAPVRAFVDPACLAAALRCLAEAAHRLLPDGGGLVLEAAAPAAGAEAQARLTACLRGLSEPGLDERDLEPYARRGTGLALAAVRGVVEQSGGTLELGKIADGVTLTLRLPAAA